MKGDAQAGRTLLLRCRKMPDGVLFRKFSIANSSYIRTTSEIAPELFMQLVPRYCFSNLPPSESKDIPQQVMDHLSPISATKKGQKICDKKSAQKLLSRDAACSDAAESVHEARCAAPRPQRGGAAGSGPPGLAWTDHGPPGQHTGTDTAHHGALRGRTLCALL